MAFSCTGKGFCASGGFDDSLVPAFTMARGVRLLGVADGLTLLMIVLVEAEVVWGTLLTTLLTTLLVVVVVVVEAVVLVAAVVIVEVLTLVPVKGLAGVVLLKVLAVMVVVTTEAEVTTGRLLMTTSLLRSRSPDPNFSFVSLSFGNTLLVPMPTDLFKWIRRGLLGLAIRPLTGEHGGEPGQIRGVVRIPRGELATPRTGNSCGMTSPFAI